MPSVKIDGLNPNNLQDCYALLRQLAMLCDSWATESQKGGWSTHQVEGNRDTANKVYAFLGRARV